MFAPPPVMRYSPFAGSKLTEPGLAVFPMSVCSEKMPKLVVASPKASFAPKPKIKSAEPNFFINENPAASPFHRFEIINAQRDLLFGGWRFVLNEIPFHAGFFRRAQNWRVINPARSQRDIVRHVRMTGQEAGGRALPHAFEMHQLPAF